MATKPFLLTSLKRSKICYGSSSEGRKGISQNSHTFLSIAMKACTQVKGQWFSSTPIRFAVTPSISPDRGQFQRWLM